MVKAATDAILEAATVPVKERYEVALLDQSILLNNFFLSVERRALQMARFSVSEEEDALDIVQDAMLSFVKKYASKPEEEWRPLFYRVLHSRITDFQRRESVRSRFRFRFFSSNDEDDDEDPLERLPDAGAPLPIDLLERRDLGDAVNAGLKLLPARQRQAFLLRAWEGLDTAETAAAMGCSEGSVKTHYFRAVHALRKMLEEYRP